MTLPLLPSVWTNEGCRALQGVAPCCTRKERMSRETDFREAGRRMEEPASRFM
jgi:hypothetical protein